MNTSERIAAASAQLIDAAGKIADIASKIKNDDDREYLLNFMSCKAHDLKGAVKHLKQELNDKIEACDAHTAEKIRALNQLAGALGTTPEAILKGESKDASVNLQGQQLGAKQGEVG